MCKWCEEMEEYRMNRNPAFDPEADAEDQLRAEGKWLWDQMECPQRPALYDPNTDWSTDFGLVMRGPSDFGDPIYDEYAQWVEQKKEGGWKNWLKKLRRSLM